MIYCEITEAQALAAQQILIKCCGLHPASWAGEGFVRAVRTDTGERYVCHEFRFMGDLGFGGKFRNDGSNNNTPYVDCYSENLTPERQKMINAANARLKELFAPGAK